MAAETTYYLVCLHQPCSQEAADFIAECLSKPETEGGADLVVRQEKMAASDGLVLHVSATSDRLKAIAEDMELKKADKAGLMREYRAESDSDFDPSGVVGPLTWADVQRCVLYAMEMVHFDFDTRSLPGHPRARVMKGASVLSAYQEAGLIDAFALHDDETVSKLYAEWKSSPFLRPPIDSIRDYFGESVALYISFAAFYTAFLMPVAALGVAHAFLGFESVLYSNVVFAGLNLVAVTMFLELWKRRSNEHAFKFGTAGKLRSKRPRPAFRGQFGLNPVTGRDEVQYPFAKTLRKLVLVSVPATIFCLAGAFLLMLGSFEAERIVVEWAAGSEQHPMLATAATYVPSIVYSVMVFAMNINYLRLARWLTEWENHRTQEQFEAHVVAKLVVFEFVNTFVALFYVAFYLHDVPMLRSQVSTMLVVLQIVNQLQETVLPVFLRRPSTRRVMHKIAKKLNKSSEEGKGPLMVCQHGSVSGLACLDDDSAQVGHAVTNLSRDPYESTYDDFMEMWLQFGHVFMFSSVFPLAGLFALANNLAELRMDAYKLCRVMRKPTPRAVRDIGAWYAAFSATSTVAVMTNCALLAMDPDVQAFAPSYHASPRDWVLLFVALEHVLLAARALIDRAIPDVSTAVKLAQDRNEFMSKKRS